MFNNLNGFLCQTLDVMWSCCKYIDACWIMYSENRPQNHMYVKAGTVKSLRYQCWNGTLYTAKKIYFRLCNVWYIYFPFWVTSHMKQNWTYIPLDSMSDLSYLDMLELSKWPGSCSHIIKNESAEITSIRSKCMTFSRVIWLLLK